MQSPPSGEPLLCHFISGVLMSMAEHMQGMAEGNTGAADASAALHLNKAIPQRTSALHRAAGAG